MKRTKILEKQYAVMKNAYDEMKSQIITDMWFLIKDREGSTLDIMETRGIPALVTQIFDDQSSETIDELIVKEDKVIAIASSCFAVVNEYNLEEFDVPFLLMILDSVEKHIEKEK